MNVAIVGAGAAGYFTAIQVCENYPDAKVVIFEKSRKVLGKVKISGGGRCNVTNGCTSEGELIKAYPRGQKLLKKLFKEFNTRHAMRWFESRGVALVTQDDLCVFPESQDSQTIIDCLQTQAVDHAIAIRTSTGVSGISKQEGKLTLSFTDARITPESFDKVIITTGGSPRRSGLDWLADLGHEIEEPVPSLFTFNMPDESVRDLMGVVVEKTLVNIQGTKVRAEGPLLITHWGMSGPAILKLSAFGARLLSECDYNFKVQVNWVNTRNNDVVGGSLAEIVRTHAGKQLSNFRPFGLPDRLWQHLLKRSGYSPDRKWGELGKKGINKLVTVLTDDVYAVNGKTTFKEEFVTCGGVSLASVDTRTLQSKVCDNLYFAGEVLDVDGITGGYNFQAAWTTAFIAAKLES